MNNRKEANIIEYCCGLIDELKKEKKGKKEKITSKRSKEIHEQINKVVKYLLEKVLPYEMDIQGLENIPIGPVIFANSHQDFYDIINSINACPSHLYTLNSSAVTIVLKALLKVNGVIFVDRFSKESREQSKVEMVNHLKNGSCINVYPEATFNRSANRLHLPYSKGIIDIAQETGCPIVPVVQEYKYEYDKNKKLVVKKIYMKYGEPVIVKENDNVFDKLDEFDEKMSTLHWELIESTNDVLPRNQIDEQYYIDLMERKKKAIESAGSNIEAEDKSVLSFNDKYFETDYPVNESLIKKGR